MCFPEKKGGEGLKCSYLNVPTLPNLKKELCKLQGLSALMSAVARQTGI